MLNSAGNADMNRCIRLISSVPKQTTDLSVQPRRRREYGTRQNRSPVQHVHLGPYRDGGLRQSPSPHLLLPSFTRDQVNTLFCINPRSPSLPSTLGTVPIRWSPSPYPSGTERPTKDILHYAYRQL